MFHGFLRSRARATLPGDDIRAIHAAAAQTLEKNNDLEGGFSMCAGANAWERAERLLIDHAAELISQGRWRTLQQWVRALPKKRAEKNPWVRYWHALSLIWIEPVAVQTNLQFAYKQFLESGNKLGQALTAVGILETFTAQTRTAL
jgi:ATP/maltotriose-dependent transcriptional regulator MalT